MSIVRADQEKLQEAAHLFNAYRMFYGQPSDLEGAVQFLNERLEQKDSVIFIAYRGGVAAGFVQLYPLFSSVGMKRTYILNDLFVDPEFRKRGLGRELMEQAFEFCKQEGAGSVSLQTAPDNHRAKALYEKAGMQLDTEYDWYSKVL